LKEGGITTLFHFYDMVISTITHLSGSPFSFIVTPVRERFTLFIVGIIEVNNIQRTLIKQYLFTVPLSILNRD